MPADAVVNVRTYGARGDGVTDDTAALQRAISENLGYGKSKKILYFGAGTFRTARNHQWSPGGLMPDEASAFDELRATTHLAEILATFERNPLPHAFAVRAQTSSGSSRNHPARKPDAKASPAPSTFSTSTSTPR